MSDILDKLKDLLKQATTERSHNYVASCCREAINEIEVLRRTNEGLENEVSQYIRTIVALRSK